MVCIYCGGSTKVTNSRASKKGVSVWRRRECTDCRRIVSTREYIDLHSALRMKKTNGSLEPFLRDKLLMSIHSSLSHRKTAYTDATELTDTSLRELTRSHTNGIISKKALTVSVHRILNHFDNAAGVYYEAHYTAR